MFHKNKPMSCCLTLPETSHQKRHKCSRLPSNTKSKSQTCKLFCTDMLPWQVCAKERPQGKTQCPFSSWKKKSVLEETAKCSLHRILSQNLYFYILSRVGPERNRVVPWFSRSTQVKWRTIPTKSSTQAQGLHALPGSLSQARTLRFGCRGVGFSTNSPEPSRLVTSWTAWAVPV